MNSLDSKFHETVTAYQEVEALSNAIAILAQWRDLSELAKQLEEKRRDLLAHMPHGTDETYRTY